MATRLAVSLAILLALASMSRAQSKAQPVDVLPPPIEAGKTANTTGPVSAEGESGFMAPANEVSSSRPSDRWWVTGDYLFGWTRSSGIPPLVTTSPAGTAQTAAGVLGQSTTSTPFGNQNVNGDLRSGFQLGMGGWFDSERTIGMDAGFFVLESRATLFNASSQGNPILARPFTDTASGTASSQLVAFPGVGTGSIAVSARSNNVWGAHVDFQEAVLAYDGFRLEPLAGYQFLKYSDRLAVDANVVSAGANGVEAGTQIQTSDRFTAINTFHGADLGLKTELYGERWSLAVLAKLDVGTVDRNVGIAGVTQVTVPGATNTIIANGGMLALSSNSGAFASHDWTIVPEVGVDFAWKVTDQLHLHLGYSFIYWVGVTRAADAVSLNINPALFPPATPGATPSSPTFSLVKSDVWIQSVSMGLEFRF